MNTDSNNELKMYKHPLQDLLRKNANSVKILTGRLDDLVIEGKIAQRAHPDTPQLVIYNYTKNLQHSSQFCEYTTIARGLIIDIEKYVIVAVGFPKFFNLGEHQSDAIVDINKIDNSSWACEDGDEWEVSEKYDGSLGITFFNEYTNLWDIATRGSFDSEMAIHARKRLQSEIKNNSRIKSLFEETCLNIEHNIFTSFLVEIIYPDNKIVVDYGEEDKLAMIGYIVCSNNPLIIVDYSYSTCLQAVQVAGLTRDDYIFAESRNYKPLVWSDSAIDNTKSIIANIEKVRGDALEGVVVRLCNGQCFKLKTEEYCLLHKVTSRLTPLAVWESLLEYGFENAHSDKNVFFSNIPDEFYDDYDNIVASLKSSFDEICNNIRDKAEDVKHLDDKDLGLFISGSSTKDLAFRFLFSYRKFGSDAFKINGENQTFDKIMKIIRPRKNKLQGTINKDEI